MSERSLLLDTCALIWLSSDAAELSEQTRTAINVADTVWVSAISAWEISLKVARETLELPLEPGAWFDRAMDHHHLSLAALDVNVLVAANALPWHHRDPADRFIIATARSLGAAVVTADRKFEQYDVMVLR
ncbi:MAG TPA: PIN domain nuclease [Candidatus Latescibacteria bacterium]|jgi:PIN domain nuclease of toxin-antitoxin system|nr:PIN domain nuclease [Candidatus Latescibacterota bacterium]